MSLVSKVFSEAFFAEKFTQEEEEEEEEGGRRVLPGGDPRRVLLKQYTQRGNFLRRRVTHALSLIRSTIETSKCETRTERREQISE